MHDGKWHYGRMVYDHMPIYMYMYIYVYIFKGAYNSICMYISLSTAEETKAIDAHIRKKGNLHDYFNATFIQMFTSSDL